MAKLVNSRLDSLHGQSAALVDDSHLLGVQNMLGGRGEPQCVQLLDALGAKAAHLFSQLDR